MAELDKVFRKKNVEINKVNDKYKGLKNNHEMIDMVSSEEQFNTYLTKKDMKKGNLI